MEAISYTAIRNALAKALDRVNDDCTPILITRQKGRPAVLMSLEDFRAWEETAYLMRSAKNAARLNQAMVQIEAGKAKPHALMRGASSGPTRPGKTTSGGKRKTRASSRASMR